MWSWGTRFPSAPPGFSRTAGQPAPASANVVSRWLQGLLTRCQLREAREAIAADHPLLNQLRTDRAEPSPTSPTAQSSSATSADSAEETATPPATTTALPSPEVLASMDASQADPALLAAMRRFLSQVEGQAGGQAAA